MSSVGHDHTENCPWFECRLIRERDEAIAMSDLRGNLLCALAFDVVMGMPSKIQEFDLPGSVMGPGVARVSFETFGRTIRQQEQMIENAGSWFSAIAFDASRAGWAAPTGDRPLVVIRFADLERFPR